MKVLFICRVNVGRSQIAEAFFNNMSKMHSAVSAGTEAIENNTLPENVINSMKEMNYDMSTKRAKKLTQESPASADKIIVLMEPDERERFLPEYIKNSKKVVYWSVGDGKGKSYNYHLEMRDKIKQLIESLVKEIG